MVNIPMNISEFTYDSAEIQSYVIHVYNSILFEKHLPSSQLFIVGTVSPVCHWRLCHWVVTLGSDFDTNYSRSKV